jgi:SulP family sulfate permease
MIHSLFLFLFMLVAAPLAGFLPLAALGAVLAVVAWNMAEREDFILLLRSSRGDRIVLLTTFLLTVFVDLTTGIAVGVVLGAFVFLHRMAESVEVQGHGQLIVDDEPDDYSDTRAYDPAAFSDRDIVVYRISGAFFFRATAAVSGVLERIGRPRVFVLDFSDVPMVDSTGAKTLKRLAEKLALTGTPIFITGASLKVRRSLLLAGLSKPIIRYAKTADQAVRFSRARLDQAATA